VERLDVSDRRSALEGMLAATGFVSVADASGRLGVSEVTVRGDLAALAAAGLARRVHGGAVAMAPRREAPVESTAEKDADLKRAIGVAAADHVVDGMSVMLDVGSTTLAVARALAERADLHDVVVITNGLAVASALEPAIPRLTVLVTGGTLRPLQHSLVDALAVDSLRGLHADLAIVGCTGIADGQVTNVNLPEAAVKRAMIDSATTRMLVADASKFGRRDLVAVAPLDAFDTVVTAGAGAGQLELPATSRLIVAP
jgi:DeoR family transcriptional regulator of aga operon